MKRLTIDKDVSEMSMYELAHNSCYVKEENARVRDFENDFDTRELAIKLLEKYADIPNEFTCDDDFDEFMLDSLQYGTDSILGLIAVFYRNLWAMADLRERLKEYEDLEERLQAVYGECNCLLGKVVEHLERHVGIDLPDPVFKSRLLTDNEVDRWQEYKKLEEQGKLLKLPCAVGDTVYRICPKCNDSHDGSCKNCAWENSCSNRGCTVYGVWEDGQYPIGKCTIVPYKVFWNYIPNLLENIGKRVFLAIEEAEATLKEL